MPFFAPTDDPGASFPELLRRMGMGPEASTGSIDVPHATTCVALRFTNEEPDIVTTGVLYSIKHPTLVEEMSGIKTRAQIKGMPTRADMLQVFTPAF